MTKLSTSQRIRNARFNENRSVKGIAKRLGLRYQHVYNVVGAEVERRKNADALLG